MLLRLLAAGFALGLIATAAPAEDKKDNPATTTWLREVNGIDLKFELGKDTMKASVFQAENGFVANCKITRDKDGTIKVKVTDVEEKGSFPAKPKVGFEFSFKLIEKGDAAELSDLKGENLEDAKPVIEGEYKKKK